MGLEEDINGALTIEARSSRKEYLFRKYHFPKIEELSKKYHLFDSLETKMDPAQDTKLCDVWKVRDFACEVFRFGYTAGYTAHKSYVQEKRKRKKLEEQMKKEREEFLQYKREKSAAEKLKKEQEKLNEN